MDLVTHLSPPAREPIRFSTDDRLAGQDKGEVPRILIVEDDYVVGLELENALSEAGFGVVGTANSAEEAVRLAISERPVLAGRGNRPPRERVRGEGAVCEVLPHCGALRIC